MSQLTKTSLKAKEAVKALKQKANSKKSVEILERFFKTGPGEYGEGDVFIGVPVPYTRLVAKQFHELPRSETIQLLKSQIHEERLLALLILTNQFAKADEKTQKQIYTLFMKNLRYVNNWDLVDSSAHLIAGAYLFDKSRAPLYKLARSKKLWEKRVAIIGTYWFIRKHEFEDTLKISEILLKDDHDLIHKAVGWMLREVGNRDFKSEEKFLKKHYKKMPRTMLRYAIEKFPEKLRLRYLKGEV